MQTTPNPRPPRGVTLIESAVVMAVAVIALSTVAPSLQGLIERKRLEGVVFGEDPRQVSEVSG